MLPSWNRSPAFKITRASHVCLSVCDLAESVAFYRDVIGLVVTEQTDDTAYLRGLEEAAFYSLALRQAPGRPTADRIGFRVATEQDIERAMVELGRLGVEAKLVELPHQGPALHFRDPVGMHIELTSSMELAERQLQHYHLYRAGAPQRLDHFQLVTTDVQRATEFYSELGFRLAEYTAADGTDALWGSWLEVKGNTHDLVFTNGRGPRMHHFAFTVPDVASLMHAADVTGSHGLPDAIDRGPGRHGISNALFLYIRDPDGHRIELFTSHYQYIDIETPPMRWDVSDPRRSQLWGLPATRRWFYEASEFPGEPVHEPVLVTEPATLEDYLAVH